MGVRKTSNSKRDLQNHSRALAIVPFDRPHMISYVAIFHCFQLIILSLNSQNLKRSRDSEHIPFGGNISCNSTPESNSTRNLKCLASAIPKTWLGLNIFTKRVTWPSPHPLGGSLSSKASIWYILPAYIIWQLLLQPLPRYDCGHQNTKWVMWPWPRPF